ncbi:Putative sulfatase-modifying factor enzyme, C-type lectin [Septoria linicola]|uniref:Sulfatase-modifying factor enzyme, C-type lectin n=1 Tax=Septoria linicola TaxID=215465 RepID=A0A9Q9AT01_9PEZI|nr:Putative sulfatase-modifying factor enzyme, C-type lectin [Septoria linicola]
MLLDAGSALSHLCDPRDLMSLAEVPAGKVTIGSTTHANSQPLHEIALQSFKIGKYPVTTREYARFAATTGRYWSSPDQRISHRQNVPATDLTWFDAVAYCQWLTQQWQDSARISLDERVRLPTEPEWERASRGDLQQSDSNGSMFSWGTSWQEDSCNSEETGLNQTCSVGSFPKGVSSHGCYAMAGNAWEWCTTLWGDHMSTPSFSYPWQNDVRENLTATSTIRRVLRGGCFSSSKLKANCTYRGSLEPNGFWRGNGFRIVVASHD